MTPSVRIHPSNDIDIDGLMDIDYYLPSALSVEAEIQSKIHHV